MASRDSQCCVCLSMSWLSVYWFHVPFGFQFRVLCFRQVGFDICHRRVAWQLELPLIVLHDVDDLKSDKPRALNSHITTRIEQCSANDKKSAGFNKNVTELLRQEWFVGVSHSLKASEELGNAKAIMGKGESTMGAGGREISLAVARPVVLPRDGDSDRTRWTVDHNGRILHLVYEWIKRCSSALCPKSALVRGGLVHECDGVNEPGLTIVWLLRH